MALKELIEIQRLHMGENFVPALLILGGMGMALHYEELSAKLIIRVFLVLFFYRVYPGCHV